MANGSSNPTVEAPAAAKPATAESHAALLEKALMATKAAEEAAKAGGAVAQTKLQEAKDAIEKAKNTPVVVRLSCKTDADIEQRKINIWQNVFAGGVLVFGGVLVLNDWLVANGHILIHVAEPYWISFIPIVATVLFLMLLLRSTVYRGSPGKERCPYIPDRGPALLLLTLLYFGLVLCFAHLNLASELSEGVGESVYKALMTVATLDHEHYQIGDSGWGRGLVGGEIISIVLLIIVFFPLLVARLALFDGETVSREEFEKYAKTRGEAPWPNPTITLTADGAVEFKEGANGKGGSKATIVVNQSGEATFQT
ncbi:MAG TPA: hypothetical protein VJP87_13955 [Candidatus Acidoferrales bacterium]|nr:hypothetical protein [Candidatus Acidoferrales bacterium]